MNLIEKAIEQLKPSRPIFKIYIADIADIVRMAGDRGSNRAANIERISGPDLGKRETPIEKTVALNFREEWARDRYVIAEDAINIDCKNDIKQIIMRFLRHHMKQKYPMETKMGRFYNDKMFSINVPAFDTKNLVLDSWANYVEVSRKDMEETQPDFAPHLRVFRRTCDRCGKRQVKRINTYKEEWI